jgi:hypothetical protein
MAGGMILMAVFTTLLPVPTAMVMHGSTRLISNVARADILGSHIFVKGLLLYLAGSICAAGQQRGRRRAYGTYAVGRNRDRTHPFRKRLYGRGERGALGSRG